MPPDWNKIHEELEAFLKSAEWETASTRGMLEKLTSGEVSISLRDRYRAEQSEVFVRVGEDLVFQGRSRLIRKIVKKYVAQVEQEYDDAQRARVWSSLKAAGEGQ